MAVIIRPAREFDLGSLRTIFDYGDDFHAAALPALFTPGPDSRRSDDFLLSCLNNAEGALFLAEEGTRPCGLMYVLERSAPDLPLFVPRRYALVDTLIVMPEAQRRGIGRALLGHAEEWARQRGLAQVELGVHEFNVGAIALYEAVGYRTERRVMAKQLPASSQAHLDREF